MLHNRRSKLDGKGKGKGKEKVPENKDEKGTEKTEEEEWKPKNLKVIKFRFNTECKYQEFLRVLRNSVSNGVLFCSRITQLKPPLEEDTLIIDIHLSTYNNAGIVLRILSHDVYLIGYKSNQQNKWYCLKNVDYLIFFPFGTKMTTIGESYSAMGPLVGTDYGYNRFIAAIHGLETATNDDDMKKHFKLFIVMVCEAARFDPIGKQTCLLVRQWGDCKLMENYNNLIHNWETYSSNLKIEGAKASKEFPIICVHDKDPTEDMDTEEVEVGSNYLPGVLDDDWNDAKFEEDGHDLSMVNRDWLSLSADDKANENKATKSARYGNWRRKQIVKLLCSSSIFG